MRGWKEPSASAISSSSSGIAPPRWPAIKARNIRGPSRSAINTRTPISSSLTALRDAGPSSLGLLPAQLRGRLDAVEPLERQDRIRKLIGAAVEHRAGQRQKLLLHRLRVRK